MSIPKFKVAISSLQGVADRRTATLGPRFSPLRRALARIFHEDAPELSECHDASGF